MRYKIRDDRHLEDIVNERLGLRTTKNSGALHGDGDGKGRTGNGDTYDELLVDCKFTEKVKKTVSITKGQWYKTKKMALRNGRIPIMATFTPDDKDGTGTVFVHLALEDFERLIVERSDV